MEATSSFGHADPKNCSGSHGFIPKHFKDLEHNYRNVGDARLAWRRELDGLATRVESPIVDHSASIVLS